MVSSFSIGLVMLFSRDLRIILLQGHQIIEDKDKAQRSLYELQGKQKSLEGQIRALDASIAINNTNLSKTSNELIKSDADLRTKKEQIRLLQSSMIALRRQLSAIRLQLAPLQAKLAQKTTELQAKTTSLTKAAAELALTTRQLAEKKTELHHAEQLRDTAVGRANEVDQQNLALIRENAKLETEQDRLKGEVQSLQADQTRIAAEREAANRELVKITNAYHAAQTQIDGASQELQKLQVYAAAYESISTSSRTQPEIFAAGEEIVRLPIKANLNYESASAAVTSLLRMSRLAAESRGAKANGKYLAADIVERSDARTNQTISQSDEIRRIVRTIVGHRDQLVLIANATLNTFKGEVVAVDITPVPNPLIYRQGAVIAETKVDATETDAAIYKTIGKFVNEQLRPKLLRDRMLPPGGSDQSIGEITPDQIFALIREIHEADRVIRLQIVASDDLRAADPLKFTFRVR